MKQKVVAAVIDREGTIVVLTDAERIYKRATYQASEFSGYEATWIELLSAPLPELPDQDLSLKDSLAGTKND